MKKEISPKSGPSIFRNAIYNWAALFYVAAISFFLSPVVVHTLGAAAYGVWSLLVAVVGYLGLLDFGVRGAVTRYVAHHHAVNDLESSSLIMTSAMVLFGVLGSLAVLIACGISWLAPHLFNIPPDLMAEARIVLIIGGITMLATLIGAVFGGAVTGLERFDISSTAEIGLTTFRSAAVFIALKTGYGLVTLALIHLGSAIVYGIIMWIAVRKILPSLRFRFRERLMPWVRTILSFSAYLSAIHVLGAIIFYTDALVIAAALPVAAVGMYAIAGTLIDYAQKIAGSLSKMFTPRVSALSSAGSGRIVSSVLDGARAATLVTLPIAITFVMRGEEFINLWMGPEYGPTAGAVLRVLAFVIWVGGARTVGAASIIGVNMHRKLIPILAFEATCNLVLSVVLVRIFGVVGVAVGTLIPGLIVSLVLIPRCLKQVVDVPRSRYYIQALLRPTVSCVPFAIVTWLLGKYMPAGGLLVFFSQVALAIPVAVAGIFYVCLSGEERATLVAGVRARVAAT